MNFDITCDEDHIYRVNDIIKPGVTEILEGSGFIDSKWFTPESAQRGTYVHKAVELFHTVGLDISSVHSSLMPYFSGYLKFIDDLKWKAVKELVEKPLYHSVYQYCGRIDVPFYNVDGGKEGGIDLVDIKTGSLPFHVKYQLEGYGELLRNAGYKIHNLWTLLLPGNGTYSLIHYGSARNLQVFMAGVTIENAKRGLI